MKWRVPWKIDDGAAGVEEVMAESETGACAKVISIVRIRYGEVTVTAGPPERLTTHHESWKNGVMP
jgi:hypothetical protein